MSHHEDPSRLRKSPPLSPHHNLQLLSVTTSLGIALRSYWHSPNQLPQAHFKTDFFWLTDLLVSLSPLAHDHPSLDNDQVLIHCILVLNRISTYQKQDSSPGSASACFQRNLGFIDLKQLKLLLQSILLEIKHPLEHSLN
jgi:hypothetical protein